MAFTVRSLLPRVAGMRPDLDKGDIDYLMQEVARRLMTETYLAQVVQDVFWLPKETAQILLTGALGYWDETHVGPNQAYSGGAVPELGNHRMILPAAGQTADPDNANQKVPVDVLRVHRIRYARLPYSSVNGTGSFQGYYQNNDSLMGSPATGDFLICINGGFVDSLSSGTLAFNQGDILQFSGTDWTVQKREDFRVSAQASEKVMDRVLQPQKDLGEPRAWSQKFGQINYVNEHYTPSGSGFSIVVTPPRQMIPFDQNGDQTLPINYYLDIVRYGGYTDAITLTIPGAGDASGNLTATIGPLPDASGNTISWNGISPATYADAPDALIMTMSGSVSVWSALSSLSFGPIAGQGTDGKTARSNRFSAFSGPIYATGDFYYPLLSSISIVPHNAPGDGVTYSLSGTLPPNLQFDETTGAISGLVYPVDGSIVDVGSVNGIARLFANPTENDVGTFAFRITASHGIVSSVFDFSIHTWSFSDDFPSGSSFLTNQDTTVTTTALGQLSASPEYSNSFTAGNDQEYSFTYSEGENHIVVRRLESDGILFSALHVIVGGMAMGATENVAPTNFPKTIIPILCVRYSNNHPVSGTDHNSFWWDTYNDITPDAQTLIMEVDEISISSGIPWELSPDDAFLFNPSQALTFKLVIDDPIRHNTEMESFPPGLSLDGLTGRIHGTPTTPGTYYFTVDASHYYADCYIRFKIVVS